MSEKKSCVSGIFFRFFGNELQVFFQAVRYCRQMHHVIGLIYSNSIKFHYEVVMGMPHRFYAIDRPRKKEQLPKVISLEEVQQIIENTNNMKHKCIVSLVFSAGLRRGELLNLKLSDI